jgi:hypothetical protein
MSRKKVLIKYHPDREPFEFEVGKLVTIQHHYQADKLLPKQFLTWVNNLAEKGLIFHGEYDGRCVFRVDGDVIEKLKNELELTEDSHSEYVGENDSGRSMYKTETTLNLYLDGEVISQVSLP